MTDEILSAINETVGTEVFGVWFLIGAAFVFFMQAGFAMVETGFTRAKNAGNIIMKNLMDFCIGTVVFILIGFGTAAWRRYAGRFYRKTEDWIFLQIMQILTGLVLYFNLGILCDGRNHRIRSHGRTNKISYPTVFIPE